QMKVTLVDGTDIAAASAGTRYYIGNPGILSVTPDGLVTALAPGFSALTVIDGAAEQVVPVVGGVPRASGGGVDGSGGVVQGADGPLLMLAPGALQAPTAISLTPVSAGDVTRPMPAGFQFVSAFNLDFGSQPLAVTAQIAAPFPNLPAGTNVYLLRAGVFPDETGQLLPTWYEAEKAIVGADGIARTTSPPYSGIVDPGQYVWSDGATGSFIVEVHGHINMRVVDNTHSILLQSIPAGLGEGLAAAAIGSAAGYDVAIDVSMD